MPVHIGEKFIDMADYGVAKVLITNSSPHISSFKNSKTNEGIE